MSTSNPIFCSGWYDPSDASKGDNLNNAIRSVWHNWGINLTMSVYDRDVAALIPATGIIPVLVGHSFGGWKINDVAWGLWNAGDRRPLYLCLIDPVPNPPQNPFNGFVLSPNVVAAYCVYRKTRSDGKTPITEYFSGPIATVNPAYQNVVYVPHQGASKDPNGKPMDPQADEHGQQCWNTATGNVVKQFMLASGNTPPPTPPPIPPMPAPLPPAMHEVFIDGVKYVPAA